MGALTANRFNLSKTRLLHLLETLKGSSSETSSLCLTPGISKPEAEALLANVFDPGEAPEDLPKIIAGSPTGAVLFWGGLHRYLVMPPFPIKEERFSGTCEIEPLCTLLNSEFTVGLVVLRMGSYAVAVIKGERLITSKAGTGLVHARHRQGGSSAHRFERHREKQMETFFTRVCTHVREQLEPYSKNIEFLVYGGTRETLLDFRKQCHFLHEFDSRALGLLLNIREPRQSNLAQAIEEVWSSRVIEWRGK
jgi:hypothetical protein